MARGDDAMELSAHSSIALLYATATPKFDPELGRRLSEELVVMARRIGDRSAEARALWNIVVANVYGGGDAARAIEAGEASLVIARDLGEREQLAFTLNDVTRAYMALGDFSTAAQRLAEARAALGGARQPSDAGREPHGRQLDAPVPRRLRGRARGRA